MNEILRYKSHSGLADMEAIPSRELIAITYNNQCVAIWSYEDLWSFMVDTLLNVSTTNNMQVLRITKEAAAAIEWRKNNI